MKTKRLIEEADCIVYDRLVGKEIMSLIPTGTEVIDVGKHVGHHVTPQEEINQILVREAKKGKMVLRLKGGDPFLFGRGGEELEELRKEGIPFEEVPGVTSPIAVPAYNGIPVTHRDFVSSLHIVTGHQKAGKETMIPYQALVDTKGTLVFMMGVHNLSMIMDGLIEAGMRKDMPAAVLQQGVSAAQRKVIATVATLAEKAREAKIKAPAIIIVGEVCQLSEEFAWYEHLPLFGEKIIVTRPNGRGNELPKMLREAGAEVLEIPTICTKPVCDEEKVSEIAKVIEGLDTYNMVVFTSPYGVECFFEDLISGGKDLRAIAHMKFAVIGQGTKDALRKKGICADYMPDQFDGESLGRLLAEEIKEETRILLARSSIGAKEILCELQKNPWIDYTDLAIYDTEFPEGNRELLQSVISDGNVTKVVFTSSSTVDGFVELKGDISLEGILAICIGKKTMQTATAAGMETVTAKNATMDELMDAIQNA